MAEIRVTAGIEDVDNGVRKLVNSLSRTLSDEEAFVRVTEIGTSEESVAFPADITSPGYVFVRNMDGTNYVELGFATTVYYLRLKAGDVALFPIDPSTTTLYLKANTAAVNVEIFVRAA